VTEGREALERRWLHLTREALPSAAAARGWRVTEGHCFQRILLDVVCGGVWYDHVQGRPAYRHLDAERLGAAVALGEAVVSGDADLTGLNARSLVWRRERR